MSARIATARPSSRSASRIVSMRGPSVAPSPCEKFTRQASAPARMSSRIRSSDAVAGPIVAMIFVHSIGYITADDIMHLARVGSACRLRPMPAARPFDAAFLADLPYDPEVLLFDGLLLVDAEQSRVQCSM